MSEPNLEQPANPAEFGTWLAQKTRAEQQAKLDALADLDAHRGTHDYLTRSQKGITGMTGQQQAAAVADRPATVGSDYGGRPLEKLGGLYDHHVSSPHPPSRDLRNAGQPGGRAYDPLASLRQSRGQQ